MKPGLLCLLLLPACSFFSSSEDPEVYEYVLTWHCASESCGRVDEVARIDRATRSRYIFHFTSMQDASFSEEADRIYSDVLPAGCSWLYNISLFGHDLETSRTCDTPGGFELELSIPNEDATTHSQWVVSGRDVRFL